MSNLKSILESRDITLSTKVCLVKAMVFPVVMYGYESWTIKKAECRRIGVFEVWCWGRLLRVPWTARRSNKSILKEISPESPLEGLMLKLKLQYFGHLIQRTDVFKLWCWKILKYPLDCKKIQPVNPKGNQPWIFTGRTDAEPPILWSLHAKSWLIGKGTDAEKDWRQEKKGMTEDEMVWWYHRLDGHEFEQALGVGDGQGSLVCCSPWGCKESDTTELLNWILESYSDF